MARNEPEKPEKDRASSGYVRAFLLILLIRVGRSDCRLMEWKKATHGGMA